MNQFRSSEKCANIPGFVFGGNRKPAEMTAVSSFLKRYILKSIFFTGVSIFYKVLSFVFIASPFLAFKSFFGHDCQPNIVIL
jgi:hypothetical protein